MSIGVAGRVRRNILGLANYPYRNAGDTMGSELRVVHRFVVGFTDTVRPHQSPLFLS